MSEVNFRSDMPVQLVSSTAHPDLMVGASARVSTVGSQSLSDLATDKMAQRGLLDYLMRNRHMSPFEHNQFTFFVQCPIFVAREFMRHRTFSFNEECLAGSTEIYFDTPKGNGQWKRIDKHWDDWNNGVLDSLGRRRKLPSVKNARVRSYDEETLQPTLSKVINVIQSGTKPVFTVCTSDGREIKTSDNHLFFTPYGWKRLKELKVGDLTYVQHRNFSKVDPEARKVPWSLRQGIQAWTASQRDFVEERDFQKCQNCGDSGKYIDHKIPVAVSLKHALDVDNLQLLCERCNSVKTSSEQNLRDSSQMGNVLTLTGSEIVSIRPEGEEMTYDLVLEGPHHNFLGNGFVVHNSGRYKELEGVFYVPDTERPLVQEGKAGEYKFNTGSQYQFVATRTALRNSAAYAYRCYQDLLSNGVAREVARMCLPVNIYTSFYATVNARNLMKFLSLRTIDETAIYPSYPQREIEMAAQQMETLWADKMPITAELFTRYGRVGL